MSCGPLSTEQRTPWFEQSMILAGDPAPIDLILLNPRSNSSSDEDAIIISALIHTISGITQRFQICISYVGSRKFLAAMAVDAWLEEDFVYVRKFLIKSIILCHLQKLGASATLRELRDGNENQRTYSLLQLVKGVLRCHDQGLESYLEFCTDGSCRCIGLARIINDERETLSDDNSNRSNSAIAARRKQREEDRLPPVLKASSNYWKLKNKAAASLQKKQLGKSMTVYLQARNVLEENIDTGAQLHQKEWQVKIQYEIGKIASNLSMICLMSGQNDNALQYADEAVGSCPNWSKSYCRRALALEALGKYEEGQVAGLGHNTCDTGDY